MYAVSILFCGAKRQVCFDYLYNRQMLPFGFARQNQSLFSPTLFYITSTFIVKLYSQHLIFAHYSTYMYTTHNFKKLYVNIDDIMGGLVVLMEVSQTTP